VWGRRSQAPPPAVPWGTVWLRGWLASWGVAVHVLDQGGVPGSKGPDYVQLLYYVLEVAGVVVAALLLANLARVGWLLSLGVAAGPIVGYVLSRGPGLPDYTDDIGHWTEPLGLISLVVETILLILAAVSLLRFRRGGLAAA
jgi:hypothetical protein